jgi:signal transduction histidine kinase
VPAVAQPIDLAHLVEAELARRCTSVAIMAHLGAGIVVDGSPLRLSRLLANLLANAERHARSRGEVSVTADSGQALLEIIDDGPGIPAAEREAVFRRFHRRSDARRRDPAGTGLGLPIARQIAHAHNGSLHITDPPTGHPGGTRLVLRLPLHNRPATPATVRRGGTGR